jgi:hypothetical protein
MRIRTALVTARSAPAHERAIRTLMKWNINVDEAMFLGGLPKGEFLREFEPDFFFDDQTRPRRPGFAARAGGARVRRHHFPHATFLPVRAACARVDRDLRAVRLRRWQRRRRWLLRRFARRRHTARHAAAARHQHQARDAMCALIIPRSTRTTP